MSTSAEPHPMKRRRLRAKTRLLWTVTAKTISGAELGPVQVSPMMTVGQLASEFAGPSDKDTFMSLSRNDNVLPRDLTLQAAGLHDRSIVDAVRVPHRRVAVGGSDGDQAVLQIYDCNARETVKTLVQCQFGSVDCVAFSPTGSILAAGGFNTYVVLFDLETETSTTVVEGNLGILCMQFAPDGRSLAIADEGGGIYLYDMQARTFLDSELDGSPDPISLNFSPNGAIIGLTADGAPDHVLFWELNSSEELPSIELSAQNHSRVGAFAFSPDGESVVVGAVLNVEMEDDGCIEVWCLQNYHILRRLFGFRGRVSEIAFSPCDRFFAAYAESGCLTVWDPDTGSLITKLQPTLNEYRTRAYPLCFSSDGAILGVGTEQYIKFWCTDTWELQHSFESGAVSSIAFSMRVQANQASVSNSA